MLVGGVLGLVLMGGIRYMWRLVVEWLRRPTERTAEKLLVYGAGEGGLQVITALLRSRSSQYLPVALLDDDPASSASPSRVSACGRSTRSRSRSEPGRDPADRRAVGIAKTIRDIADIALEAELQSRCFPP